jgi:hypothetical protein
MIELTVFYPGELRGIQRAVFSAQHTGRRPAGQVVDDLMQAEQWIATAIGDLPWALLPERSDTNPKDITVAYDTGEVTWQKWYLTVIDAIKEYYRDNFPTQGFEVVSRICVND